MRANVNIYQRKDDISRYLPQKFYLLGSEAEQLVFYLHSNMRELNRP